MTITKLDPVECARREALFVSALQPSDRVCAADIRAAVSGAVRRYGSRGCAAMVAYEFGEHPQTAVGRMRWAAASVMAAFPSRPAEPTRRPLRRRPVAALLEAA
jgi:hypothetical protein